MHSIIHRNIRGFFTTSLSRPARQMHRLLHGAINRFSTAHPPGCQPVVLVIARSDLSAVAQRAKAEATKQSSLAGCAGGLDCFAEPVIGRRLMPTRWLHPG